MAVLVLSNSADHVYVLYDIKSHIAKFFTKTGSYFMKK